MGKTGENARRIASAVILQQSSSGLAAVLGEEQSKNLTPASFKAGKLVLKTSHGVWGQEVMLRQPEIIEEINRRLGRDLIKSIKVS